MAKYDRLYDQIKQYIQTTEDIWARLATMEAVLHHKMQSFFWTGVYVLIDGDLIVRQQLTDFGYMDFKERLGSRE